MSDLGAADLANIVWAFANAGQVDAQLFSALAKVSASPLPSEVSTLTIPTMLATLAMLTILTMLIIMLTMLTN